MSRRDQDSPVPPASHPEGPQGVTLVERVHAAGSVIPWHAHDGASLCLVLDGAFVEYSRGRALDCDPSSVKFTPAGERHWNHFHAGDVRGFMVEIDVAKHHSVAPFEAALSRSSQFHGGAQVLLARRIHAEYRARDTASPLAIEGLLLELLALVARGGDGPVRRRGQPAWVRQAFDLVHAQRDAVLTLSAVAGAVGVHPATLARGFRRAYGCTLGQMQRRLRLEFAAHRLVSTELPLAEIAECAGFFDQSHFTNAFRRHAGMPPLQYRRAMSRVV